MEGHNRERERPAQWDHQQKPPGTSTDGQSLNRFLSGISAERNKHSSVVGGNDTTHMMETPPNAASHGHDGPAEYPSQQWDPFGGASQAWRPPSQGGGGEGDHQLAPNRPGQPHHHHHQQQQDGGRAGPASWHESRVQRYPGPSEVPRLPPTRQLHQQQGPPRPRPPYSFGEEQRPPPPPGPPNPDWHPPGIPDGPPRQAQPQPRPQFQGHGFQGQPAPPGNHFAPHAQQNMEPHPHQNMEPRLPGPHPMGPRPTGPHPMGPPPMGPRQTGPHPMGPPPTGPHPIGPHPTGPHPTGPPPPRPPLGSRPPPFDPPEEFGFPPRPFQPDWNFSGPRPAGQYLPGPRPPPPAPSPSEPNQALPPPRPRPPPRLEEVSQEESQRKLDRDWLKNWLRKKRIGQSGSRKETQDKPVTISEGRRLVGELLQALHQLGQQRDMLRNHMHRDDSTWLYECRRANRSKEKVQTLQARLFSQECQLQSRMKKVNKRRARLKRQQSECHQEKQDEEARRKDKHQKIDTALAKKLHAEQEKKKEAELQEEVDKTLFEVRKKKQEVGQMLDLIKGLRKLRQLRKEAAQAKGVFPTRESDLNFEERLKPLEDLMSKQSVLYQEEERVMQVMLEEEHEEYKEQEKRRQRMRLEEKTNKEIVAKMKLLFGKDDLARPDNPIFPFQLFYHQADTSNPALLGVRHQWDQFLVPDTDPEGSSVPASWVLPSDPSSSAWASVLD